MIEFFQTLYGYRGILLYRTLASLRADARGLCLGYLWWFLEPILNTALYYFIFGVLLGGKTADFIAYLLLGTVVFQWLQSSIVGAMGTVTGRVHLFRQMPLPKYLFALVGIFSCTWKFLCVFVILLGYMIFATNIHVDFHLLWIPILIFISSFVVFGFALIFSIASAYIRDLQNSVQILFRALMFLSAVFWDVAKVPDHLELLFYSNPLATIICSFRQVVLYQSNPSLWHLCYLLCLGCFLMQLGMLWHRRIDGHILKHVQA